MEGIKDQLWRDPTPEEAKVELLKMQDRVSYCSACDGFGAVFGATGNEMNEQFAEWYLDTFGASEPPHLVENLAENNIWQNTWNPPPPPGIPCVVQNPQPLPPGLFQWQIDAINNCADVTTVVMAGEQQKKTMQQAAQKLRQRAAQQPT